MAQLQSHSIEYTFCANHGGGGVEAEKTTRWRDAMRSHRIASEIKHLLTLARVVKRSRLDGGRAVPSKQDRLKYEFIVLTLFVSRSLFLSSLFTLDCLAILYLES